MRSYAEKCGMPYVNERWLGGMLTNFDTISKRVNKMLEFERMRDSGEFEAMPKKEALQHTREMEKLQRNLGGIRGLTRRPDAIFVLDTKKEHIAVTEANKLGIPVVAVVDTNVDPELVQYPIPGNDDAIRANSLLARVIADAVEEGRFIAAKREPGPAPAARTPEQEAAFASEQAEARRAAAAAQAEREARLAAARDRARPDAAEEPQPRNPRPRNRQPRNRRPRSRQPRRRQPRNRRPRNRLPRSRAAEEPAAEAAGGRGARCRGAGRGTGRGTGCRARPAEAADRGATTAESAATETRRLSDGVHGSGRAGAAPGHRRRHDGCEEGARGHRRRHRGGQAVAP